MHVILFYKPINSKHLERKLVVSWPGGGIKFKQTNNGKSTPKMHKMMHLLYGLNAILV